jgi:SAM-dependent methyltransferase
MTAARGTVVEYYERRLAQHGPTARGMDWKDADSQRLRFEVLSLVRDLEGKSVHEIGAGAGHLCDFLRERDIPADYSGSDLSAAMVEAARHAHPGVVFERRDALEQSPAAPWDVVVCSGLFHVKLDTPESDWRAFVEAVLRRMYADCRCAIAFNMMTDRVDFRSDTLYYSNPEEMLDFCQREFSRDVVLHHDYPLYEYTVHVHRS